MDKYSIEVAGVQRELPIIKINDKLSIASFVIIGDTEIICACAKEIIKKIPDVDILVTAEANGISLTFEISRLLNMKKFIVARKSIKPYMESPLIDEVVSITTQKKQILVLDKADALQLDGKRVAIIDDVISTGESLSAIERLVEAAGGIVAVKAAILAEGKAAERKDIVFLEKLPLFEEYRNLLSIPKLYDEEDSQILLMKTPDNFANAMKGLGKEVWNNTDVNAYIKKERESWE